MHGAILKDWLGDAIKSGDSLHGDGCASLYTVFDLLILPHHPQVGPLPLCRALPETLKHASSGSTKRDLPHNRVPLQHACCRRTAMGAVPTRALGRLASEAQQTKIFEAESVMGTGRAGTGELRAFGQKPSFGL
jgi:hypothetical protein